VSEVVKLLLYGAVNQKKLAPGGGKRKMRRWLSVLPILFSLSFAVGQETQPLTLQTVH
jgi:hypothetical protein